jgi:hypothetical protein
MHVVGAAAFVPLWPSLLTAALLFVAGWAAPFQKPVTSLCATQHTKEHGYEDTDLKR